mmetsp:Transcript_884/g.2835  ORF Transcript_884/g.2835 Transcript_884/m.2835 type:complete len:234 (+) Transcript_884:95-796(+)
MDAFVGGFGSTQQLRSRRCRVSAVYGRNDGRYARRLVRMSAEVIAEGELDPGEVEGTSLRIVKYPHPSLRTENAEVTDFDEDLAKLAREMFKVMYASRGVGLAAPQVAKNIRLLVFNPDGNEKAWLKETVLVNPKIVARSDKQESELEACLSFPGMSGEVKRNSWVKVEAKTLKGKPFKMKFTDWKARIFQHEFDHLDGVVYIDRLSEEGRSKVQPNLDELVKKYDGNGQAAL